MPPEFAEHLSPRAYQTLAASVPLLLAAVVGPDRELDELEMGTAVDVLLAATTELGEEFRWSETSQAELERLRAEGPAEIWNRLRTLRDVIDAMPDDLGNRVRDFLSALCVGLTESSGGFFFHGESIGPAETMRLKKVVSTLDLPVHSSRHREMLGLAS